MFVYLQGYNNSKGVTLEASFTPDSQFVMIGKSVILNYTEKIKQEWSDVQKVKPSDKRRMISHKCHSFDKLRYFFNVLFLIKCLFCCFCPYVSGSEDGKIHVWNAESGMKVALLDGKHTGPITCLQFNPKFMTFASACSNMVSEDSSVDTEGDSSVITFGAAFGGCTVVFSGL